jgi:4-hydroxymandelate oxidase
MSTFTPSDSSRRKFLQFLAGSPLFAYAGGSSIFPGGRCGAWAADAVLAAGSEIASPAQALNVFDLEAVARANLPPAHFAYMATGVENDATIRANRAGFEKFQIRARRLVDTSKLDTRVELFGTTWPTPILLSPVSSQRAFHPEGEIAAAKAARARNHLQILSTVATSSVEDVTAARGMPIWFQLYPTPDWNITHALVKRAEAAGCPVVVLTVDNPTSAGRETLARARRLDTRDCSLCHAPGPGSAYRRKPMFDSGFRRGTDIFKALALGATAVGVGRPYVWGLAAFGQAGVERSLAILKAELETTMRSMGTPSVQSITRNFVQRI